MLAALSTRHARSLPLWRRFCGYRSFGYRLFSKLKARDNLNQGVNAFKSGNYAEAADHFKTAIALDPTFDVARLYLATAYVQQYIPGTETPEIRSTLPPRWMSFQLFSRPIRTIFWQPSRSRAFTTT